MTQEQQHPMTPPPELVEKWSMDFYELGEWRAIAIQAAQWGADQELEALLVWLRVKGFNNLASDLLFVRRPKPPSLKEQALKALERQSTRSVPSLASTNDCDTIRRALEALND
jgi:hypothetical protein